MVLIDELNPVPCPLSDSGHTDSLCFASIMSTYHDINHVQPSPLNPNMLQRFVESVKCRLSPLPRTPTEPHSQQSSQNGCSEDLFFVSHGPYGIVDLGVSQTVIGEHQLEKTFVALS